MSTKYKLIIGAVAVVLSIAMVAGVFYVLSDYTSIPEGIKKTIKIEDGMSAGEIALLLEKNQLIRNADSFSSTVKRQRVQNSLQAGEYEFVTGMTLNEIIDKIVKGEVLHVKVTIPEGYNVKQIAALLAEKKLVTESEFLKKAEDYTPYDYMKTNNELVDYKAEGFLFPSTYNITPGTSADDILAMLTREFNNQLTVDMRKKIVEKNLSIREFVILASLVEKEAAVAEDRKYISKVFLNRLEIDMPLQSCATIQYILGEVKPELTIADTQRPSPYNTYIHDGLPPGPIANPGLLSMKSVINPAQDNYLYFVAKRDGKHIFSRTYAEHLVAIERASE